MLDDLNHATDDKIKEKLQAAVQEALDDETYRKVKRMSYQSHNADEVISMTTINIIEREDLSPAFDNFFFLFSTALQSNTSLSKLRSRRFLVMS